MGNPRKTTTVFAEPRRLFHLWVEWEGSEVHELQLPAETITKELASWLAGVAVYGAPNERNELAEQGMWHWHWSIPDARVAEVRAHLIEAGLVETDDLDAVW